MPIQVPRLQRLESSRSQTGARQLNIQAPDASSSIATRTQATRGLVQEGADLYQEFENQKIDQLSKDAELEFTTWNQRKLQELKQHQGDPTEAYATYEEEAQQKREEILQKHPDATERVKRHVTTNLQDTMSKQKLKADYQRGAQQETYEKNLFESSVALKRNTLSENAAFVRPGDDSSFIFFDEGVADLKTTVAKRGLKLGTVEQLNKDAESWDHAYRNEEGEIVKVKMNGIAKQRAAVELSEGVSASVKNLLNAGEQEKAKLLFERYKGAIDTKNKATINNKFKDVDVKDKAFEFIGSIRGKSNQEQLEAINNISNPELRSEALKIKDRDDARLERLRERKAKKNYDRLASRVIERQNSEQPYDGLADLENDPLYKETWDNLTAKKKQAIRDMVKAPKRSNPKAEARVQDLLFDARNNVTTMSAEDFSENLKGLSRDDQDKYMKEFNNLRSQSSSQQRAMYNRAGKFLKDQMLVDELIQRDDRGRISGDNEIELIQARNELIDYLSVQEGVPTDKQLKDFVKEYSASKVTSGGILGFGAEENTFNPGKRAFFSEQADQQQEQASQEEVVVTREEFANYQRQFRQENGYWPTQDDVKFENFIKSKQGE